MKFTKSETTDKIGTSASLVLITDNLLVKFIALLINKLSRFSLQDHFSSHCYWC